jgi:3-methyladenine DNA glycosylase AlkD
MKNIINELREALLAASDEKTKSNGQNFFKERIQFYGVKIPVVNKISKEHFKNLKGKSKDKIFDLCEKLWQSGYLEESIVACNWTYEIKKDFKPGDFVRFKKWIDSYVTNWASCDTFCNHSVGDFLMMYPEYIDDLKKFTGSDNRWMRRAAAVSLIIPARKGLFLNDIFGIADSLLTDADDLVQKGYGWMLKAASQSNQQAVFDYVMKNKAVMPRTALRYAIEKMPKELKTIAMKK